MKLQGLSIIFGLIVVPMVLVLSYYIQLQVDTIALQTSYDTKLLDATHDAMVAFELNTANEDLSSVADSLRTIIDASNNIFINTLATNMGLSNASQSYIEPYIPAILYTLYDGYYINSPTKVPVILKNDEGVALSAGEKGAVASGSYYVYDNTRGSNDEYTEGGDLVQPSDAGQLLYKVKDENKYTTNIAEAEYENDYVLKSYMPYAARYVKGNIDVTINYTLDNYINVVGNIGELYYTKSGYFISSDLVKQLKIGAEDIDFSGKFYNENDLESKIIQALNEGQEVFVKLKVKDSTVDPAVEREIEIKTNNINTNEASAIIYYAKAKIFSDWIYKNLADLEEQDIVENMSNEIIGTTEKNTDDIVYSFEGKANKIFDETQNPENNNSTFINHKFDVIKNSIQYNLNLAMSIYNETTTNSYDFNMPVISNEEWLNIINNVSIVSFMQGWNCGLKTYNNYVVVSSTNNELTVIPNEIYYVRQINFNNESGIYHRIDCPRLQEEFAEIDASALSAVEKANNKILTSFVSKEVKYDKIYDKNRTPSYLYDHKNLACYTCIIDGNYETKEIDELDIERQSAYYKAIGKERCNIYKMNATKYSEGYEILTGTSKRTLKEIKQIKVTFGHIPSTDFGENTVSIKFEHAEFPNGPEDIFILNTNQTKEQTLTLNINSNSANTITLNDIRNLTNINEGTSTVELNKIKTAVKDVKIIYK